MGLDDEVFWRDLGHLGRQSGDVVVTGNHQDLFGGKERMQAFDSDLEHTLIAVKRERWFGLLFSAEWPQARARPSSHNQGIVHLNPPDVVVVCLSVCNYTFVHSSHRNAWVKVCNKIVDLKVIIRAQSGPILLRFEDD